MSIRLNDLVVEKLLASSCQIDNSVPSAVGGAHSHQFVLGSIHATIWNASSEIFFCSPFQKSLFIIIRSMVTTLNPVSMYGCLQLMSTLWFTNLLMIQCCGCTTWRNYISSSFALCWASFKMPLCLSRVLKYLSTTLSAIMVACCKFIIL